MCVTSDLAGAKERAAKVFEIYGSLPSYRAMLDREGAAGPEDIAITGTAAEVTERISALADLVQLHLSGWQAPEADPERQARARAQGASE